MTCPHVPLPFASEPRSSPCCTCARLSDITLGQCCRESNKVVLSLSASRTWRRTSVGIVQISERASVQPRTVVNRRTLRVKGSISRDRPDLPYATRELSKWSPKSIEDHQAKRVASTLIQSGSTFEISRDGRLQCKQGETPTMQVA